MEKSLTKFTRKEVILAIFCWLSYVSCYICRLNFSALLPEMMVSFEYLENVELKLASIGSAFFIAFGISTLFTGYIGDKVKSHLIIFIGLIFSGIVNICMGICANSYIALIILWAINGIAQSCIWSPLIKMGGEYFNEKKKEKYTLILSTTIPFGTVIAYLLTMLFLNLTTWMMSFILCGIITILFSIVWLIFTLKQLQTYPKTEIINQNEEVNDSPIGIKFLLITVLISLIPIFILGALKDGIGTFGPKYIKDVFKISTTLSIALTLILPFINVLGSFIGKWINKYIKNEFITSGIFFSIGLIGTILLYFFSNVNVILTTILLAIITTSMFGVSFMLVSLLPLKFAKYGKTCTMSGILSAIYYIGCGVSMFSIGSIVKDGNWRNAYIFWFIISIIAIIVCFSIFYIWKKMNEKIK